MPTETSHESQRVALQQSIARQIEERTWGRVHHLGVEVHDDRIRVQGCTTSYYIKQLTIQAILDVLGRNSCRIDMDIEVGPSVGFLSVNPVCRSVLFDEERHEAGASRMGR